MKQRIITAVIFAAAMLGGGFGGERSFSFIFSIIALGCAWELAAMLI